jgi:hypothetical protein
MNQSGEISYRLLVRLFTDEYDQVRLKSQLRFAGVEEVSEVEFTGNESELQSLFAVLDYSGEVVGSSESASSAPLESGIQVPENEPVAPSARSAPLVPSHPSPVSLAKITIDVSVDNPLNYLVIASFTEKAMAEKYQKRLETSFSSVFIKEASANGRTLHRVVVGPVNEEEEARYKHEAADAGIEGAWMLRGSVLSSGLNEEDAVAESNLDSPAQDVPSPSVKTSAIAQAEPSPTEMPNPALPVDPVQSTQSKDDFNLAELEAASGGFFLNPKP